MAKKAITITIEETVINDGKEFKINFLTFNFFELFCSI